ncbi:LamG domain-containing protein [Flavobacterium ginsengiterrae]|uniref:Concanavalin A-like lectin/glucanase superfamily protein n=1 Tax=Flavobacterium ginsengiterrae TaxID=871695 RepID=A0ABP7GME6_9FLAO
MKKTLLTFLFVSFLSVNAQNPVQEFNFNGNLNSADNSISFLGAPTFASDRLGVANGALRLNNKAFQAVVGDLPQANKPRTISVWVKFNGLTIPNYILGYGTPANGQYFGLSQQAATGGNSDVSLIGWGDTSNVVASVPLAKDTWYFYSLTYDGAISKVYRNGELLKTVEGISRSTKGYILNIGKLNASTSINADIDDLKLYAVAMTDEQVMESYNSSKPVPVVTESAPVSNTRKITILPAKTTASNSPVTEGYKTSKNVEVFSQGKQIPGINASNITDLPEGTYLIKVISGSAKK